MICPKCKYEYREGVILCPDCGAELVEECESEKNNSPEFNPNEEICILCSAANEFEADIIIAKLRAEGVYAAKKFKGIDGYNKIILGRTILGVEILVAKSLYDTALEIIKS